MPYKILTFLLFIILSSCVTPFVEKKESSTKPKSFFVTKGFTLVYTEDLYKEKLIKGKIEDRSLIIFQNYELILKWNRSLRFALAVCTLKNEFKNAL